MRVTVSKRNIEITPALRSYIEEKIVRTAERLIGRLSLSDLPILDVEVERTTRHHRKGQVYRILVNLTLGKKLIRAEATDDDIRAACDVLEEELKREIQTHKTKSLTLLKRGARQAKKDLHYAKAARLFRKGRIRNEGN